MKTKLNKENVEMNLQMSITRELLAKTINSCNIVKSKVSVIWNLTVQIVFDYIDWI